MNFPPTSKLWLSTMVLFGNVLCPWAQTNPDKDFDSIFFDTAVRLSTTDILKAGKIADSLYLNSTSDLQRIKSLMLSANLLEKQNKRKGAIAYVLRADSLASAIKNYEWEARISGFLSTQYRIIGLIDQGKRYLKKGLEASKKIRPQSTANQYRGLVYQEMAHYAMDEKDHNQAARLLKKVNPLFSDLKNEQVKNFYLGNNEEMLGRTYLGLEDYDTAKYHYYKALALLDKIDAGASQWAGMTFHGLGKIALENKKYPQALEYLKKADTIAESIDHTSLKELVYRDLGKYYKAMGDSPKYSFYNTKYLKSVNKNLSLNQVASNDAVNRIYKAQQANLSLLNVIGMVTGVLLLFGIGLYVYMGKRRKRERERYRAILAKFNAADKEIRVPENLRTVEREERLMPKETELALLRKLKAFEANGEFTNPDLSLSSLAVDLKTNTKYLSHIINNHKKKDFNNYINELRVLSIIHKIQEDPKYQSYKISYLSEECGFSSHSKFTTVFKKSTGLTPSAFLYQVKTADGKEEVTL